MLHIHRPFATWRAVSPRSVMLFIGTFWSPITTDSIFMRVTCNPQSEPRIILWDSLRVTPLHAHWMTHCNTYAALEHQDHKDLSLSPFIGHWTEFGSKLRSTSRGSHSLIKWMKHLTARVVDSHAIPATQISPHHHVRRPMRYHWASQAPVRLLAYSRIKQHVPPDAKSAG